MNRQNDNEKLIGLNKNERSLWNFTIAISRITEIIFWTGVVMMVLMLGASFIEPAKMTAFLSALDSPALIEGLNILGLKIGTASSDHGAWLAAIRMSSLGGIISFSLFAMMFRNSALILKTITGETSFSEGVTPFQKPVVRMIREIGIFLIALPLTQLFLTWIAQLLIPEANVSVSFLDVFLGLLMICLSQCFNYGIKLEEETEGLI